MFPERLLPESRFRLKKQENLSIITDEVYIIMSQKTRKIFATVIVVILVVAMVVPMALSFMN